MVTEALVYYYLKAKESLEDGSIKGLRRKALLDFIKMINDLQNSINEDRVVDFNDVCGGYFNEN